MTKEYIKNNIITKSGRVSVRTAIKHNISVNEIHTIYYGYVGICQGCQKPTQFLGFNCGYKKCCNNKCAGKYRALSGIAYKATEKTHITNTEKYGKNYKRNFSIKSKQTKLEKYGDENYNNFEQISKTKLEKYGDENYNNFDKMVSTNLSRYGVKHFSNPEKAKQTCLSKYGTETYNNNKLAKQTKLLKYCDENYNNRQKSKQTCKSKYGFENVMQSGLFEVGYKWKDYTLPSSKTIKIQGYENKLLDELLELYDEK